MRISIVNRKLINTLFEMGTVTTIGGLFEVGEVWMSWRVVELHAICNCKKQYQAFLAAPEGEVQMFEGDTLDEVLDALESTMEELAA